MILRTCDCCGEIIKSDEQFFRIKFEKYYDDTRCDGAVLQGMNNCLNRPIIHPDFCNRCTVLIRDCIRNMQRKNMGNKAKELNV